jgi:hypothetical protein
MLLEHDVPGHVVGVGVARVVRRGEHVLHDRAARSVVQGLRELLAVGLDRLPGRVVPGQRLQRVVVRPVGHIDLVPDRLPHAAALVVAGLGERQAVRRRRGRIVRSRGRAELPDGDLTVHVVVLGELVGPSRVVHEKHVSPYVVRVVRDPRARRVSLHEHRPLREKTVAASRAAVELQFFDLHHVVRPAARGVRPDPGLIGAAELVVDLLVNCARRVGRVRHAPHVVERGGRLVVLVDVGARKIS